MPGDTTIAILESQTSAVAASKSYRNVTIVSGAVRTATSTNTAGI